MKILYIFLFFIFSFNLKADESNSVNIVKDSDRTPNPERKLKKYFPEYIELIKQEYLTLLETYGKLIQEIKKQISSTEHLLVKNWLTSYSLQLLQKHNFQGGRALKELEDNIFANIFV